MWRPCARYAPVVCDFTDCCSVVAQRSNTIGAEGSQCSHIACTDSSTCRRSPRHLRKIESAICAPIREAHGARFHCSLKCKSYLASFKRCSTSVLMKSATPSSRKCTSKRAISCATCTATSSFRRAFKSNLVVIRDLSTHRNYSSAATKSRYMDS